MTIARPAIVDFNASEKSGQSMQALKLRVTLHDRERHETMIFRLKDQAVRFDQKGQGEVSPEAVDPVSPFYSTLPTSLSLADRSKGLEVLPGETRSVDLYFELPKGIKTPEDLAGFEFAWEVEIRSNSVSKSSKSSLSSIGAHEIKGGSVFDRIATYNNDDRDLLRPQLRASTETSAPFEPVEGPGFENGEWITHNFSVWTFGPAELSPPSQNQTQVAGQVSGTAQSSLE